MAELKVVNPLVLKKLSATKENSLIAILGPQGNGKTFCGASASKFYDPTFSKPVSLSDTLFITSEKGCFDGFGEKGIDVPHWADLTEHAGEKEFTLALNSSLAIAKEMAAAGVIENVVIDTVSSIDKTWKAHKTKQYEKWGLIDALLVEHRRLVMEQLGPVKARTVLLFHTKKVGEMDATKRESLGLDAGDQLVLDISGWDAPALYRAQCSLIVPIKKTEARGKPDEFYLYPRGIGGIESKTRFSCVGDKEPANLLQLFQKIKTASKAA
jgi:hypothetical protein